MIDSVLLLNSNMGLFVGKLLYSKLLKQSIFLILLLVLVVGCASPKQRKINAGMDPLSDQELEALFSKPIKASFLSSKSGNTSIVEYLPNGVQRIRTIEISDVGTWRIVNGEQCSKLHIINKGEENCIVWFEITDGKYEAFDAEGAKAGVMKEMLSMVSR